MKIIRRTAALLLLCLLLTALTACKAMPTKAEQFSILVQGNLDEIYLGRADSTYLRFTGSTAEEVKANYETSLAQEADFFCEYFNISHPTSQIKAEVVELYREIYANVSYTVGKASRVNSRTYAVKVVVQPLNIMETAIRDHDEALHDFHVKYADVDVDALTGEERTTYEYDWAYAAIRLVRAQLSHATYRETETINVRVVQTGDKYWQIDSEDLQALDALILYYPAN